MNTSPPRRSRRIPRRIRRVERRVSLTEARSRLESWAAAHGAGPWHASTLAGVIWPDTSFRNAQGAGASASRVLKRLGYLWDSFERPVKRWGWMIR